MNLNKVFLAGNLTRNPEQKQTRTGGSVCAFGMAISRRVPNSSGEPKEEVCFIDVTAFGKTADNVIRYLTKGSNAFIEGRLVFEQWVDKAGNQRSKLKVNAENVQFITTKRAEAGENNGGNRSNKTNANNTCERYSAEYDHATERTQPYNSNNCADDGTIPF